MSLLPPNATPAERALESAMLADIDLSAVGTLWDPATCPADVLPFLAWGLSITHWDTDWNEAEKRAAVADAIPFHKIKGTRAAVEQVLARFHPLLSLTEWWQTDPPRAPHTFEVRAPADIGATFLTPETAEAIIRDVAAAKPLRAHFDFVQVLEAQAGLYMAAGGMTGTMYRSDYTTMIDTSRDWSLVLQTEDGEPILTEDGLDYLEDE
ncbi:phage tail protein, P2 protein I family [Novosphingobium sp. CF614]|uniref:phage tail protein I n=1 Tax=Novosphingobium sp. CF614 TaxID=1884364 RepID=UPI0008E4FD1F|nr:phage tail protein I [Novosphingobium sp. CF614]SFG08459.1 phage tail protein, P2 protein I family [Novosphingobium sp. CF614]